MAGWCRLSVSNYGLLVKPLYELLKEAPKGPLIWTPESEHVFRYLKMALMSALTLGLPDLIMPFELFLHERQHLTLGILAQKVGDLKRTVGYFSKQFDNVSQGWPRCLRAVVLY